ncbi:geranylgeranylglyceryl/heptaprenylglyceryl phosphate synthase [Taibaiella koreensis]|uniref:geranylgeranylglyceryl/heptaprenylglyceryl phosphate synthase n=1 Tax=Taibaiella koreensis TaxID=1268548 RepID=UPI000E59F339|nr:geranylgeranylglyceryl/heptaprenylglyceryl phosphate synthase [Taibaiella koreensis]
MRPGTVYPQLKQLKAEGRHAFAVLIDPDSISPEGVKRLAEKCNDAAVDFIFVGGSIMVTAHVDQCISQFKQESDIPVVLFPGSPSQVSPCADALLYLSLISGRNPDLLIGQHVVSAPSIKASGLEVISTGYMVIDGGVPTTVSYMSHSAPIPANKPDVALCTAWAGELQGKHVIYMDAGSGAQYPISSEMIRRVSGNIDIPLIVGGGIRTPEKVYENCQAGAQVVVVGNAIEKDLSLIREMSLAAKEAPITL